MAGDLWNFRDDVGHDRADLTGMTVDGVDGSVKDVISDTAIDVNNASLKVDRTKDGIKGAPDFEAGLGKDPAYRDAIARHYGA